MGRHQYHHFNQRAADELAAAPDQQPAAGRQEEVMEPDETKGWPAEQRDYRIARDETDRQPGRKRLPDPQGGTRFEEENVGQAQKVVEHWGQRPGLAGSNAGGQVLGEHGGQPAMGHGYVSPLVQGAEGIVQQLDFQTRGAPAGAVVTADATQGLNSQGWREALKIHQQVSVMDQMRASSPHLSQQLGQRDPMGISGAPRQGIEGPTAGNSTQPGGTPPLKVPGRGPGIFLTPGSDGRP